MKLKVAIVDDHPLFSEGLKYYLSSVASVNEVKLYSNGKEFLYDSVRGEKTDLVFMDINMPVLDGIDTTKAIRQSNSEIKVVAISSLESIEHIEQMIDAGANGYLTKSLSANEIELAIETVIKGNSYFSSNIISVLTKKNLKRTFDSKQLINMISEREMEVLKLLCQGFDRNKISDLLYITERTVDKHRQNLLEKTNCDNTVQLLLFSLKNNLVSINEN
ncbi:MAG: response regulator transcription factor [Bacteroidales bacterium]|nr:response regulator transcription factor [Bacteroidales bacterium]